jgi:hypothetical protein
MSDACDAAALWLKARLFINHAMDPGEPRTFDERALWASLALELLGKAALARVSPVLIVAPTEEGASLLAAAGLLPDRPMQTIGASTVFERCAKVFRPFNSSEARKIANNRNEWLHTGSAAFTKLPESAFWPSFWAQAAILVLAQGKEMADFVGEDRTDLVEAQLARNKQHIEHRVEALVGRAKQQLDLVRSGNAPERISAALRRPTNLTAGLRYATDAACPACGGIGSLEGEQDAGHELHHEQIAEDDWNVYVEVTVLSDYFSCPTCHLVLDGAELLAVAEIAEDFEAEGDPADFAEPEYGND